MSRDPVEALRSIPAAKALRQLVAWLGEGAPPAGTFGALEALLARGVDATQVSADARALWERTEDNATRSLCARLLTAAELGSEALTHAYAHKRARAIADAWWVGSVDVRTVRSAASEDPVTADGPVDLVVPRVCAGCGGDETTLIDFVYGFLPGDYLSLELRCGECGRYTKYTLED